MSESLLERPRLPIGAAAKLASVTRRTLERWIEAGKVRGLKVGRRRYVLLEDLESQVCPLPAARAPAPRPAPQRVRDREDAAVLRRFLARE